MAESASIQKMSTRHEAILNHLIIFPTQKYSEVAAHFGVTQAWLSTIIHSHAFQDQLARRQDELFDSAIVQDLGDKLTAAAHTTLEAYLEKVPMMSVDQLIPASDKMLGRLGFGTNGGGSKTIINGNLNVQNNHVAKEIVEEARDRIGAVKAQKLEERLDGGEDVSEVGATGAQAALPNKQTNGRAQIEGMAVRKGCELEAPE